MTSFVHSTLAALILAMLATVPAAADPIASRAPAEQSRIDAYNLLPQEQAQLQDTRGYDTLALIAIVGGVAAVTSIAMSPGVSLAVAGAVVLGYVSLN